ncbi:MAG: cellulose binding domain-containing protein [Clostridium sp.]|nr:cellulose binding domain-containing protein [Clostridium sp.]
MKSRMRIAAGVTCLLLLMCTLFSGITMPVREVKAAATTKIMPLGDSITDCDFWRTMLYNKLTDNEYDVDFVGTRGNHEGHSGMLVTDLAKSGQLANWLAQSNPDLVMMLFGTNDCWCDKGAKAILDAYTVLVGQMRKNNPEMIIVVGKVTPLIPNFSSDYVYRAKELAQAIDGWAAELSTAQSPIYVVDQFTGFDAMTDTYDGVHPNTAGSVKICDKWYETLSQILSGQVPVVSETPTTSEAPEVSETPITSEAPVVSETPVTSDVPVVSETPTTSEAPEVSETPVTTDVPSIDGKLNVESTVNDWSSGFTMSVNLTNTSADVVEDWKFVIEKSNFTIINCWCVNLEETEDAYILTPLSWNKTITSKGTISFGFQGTGDAVQIKYTIS